MKQCDDCKTFKKADNCIDCVIKAKKENDQLKLKIQEIKDILHKVQSIMDSAKNDGNKIILLEKVFEGKG